MHRPFPLGQARRVGLVSECCVAPVGLDFPLMLGYSSTVATCPIIARKFMVLWRNPQGLLLFAFQIRRRLHRLRPAPRQSCQGR